MIVRHTVDGWEVIYQGAHALLAGQIAQKLSPDVTPRFWTETLAAIIDHDDLKEDFGNNVYLTDLGAPKDFALFKFTATERYTESKRRIANANRKHRWIGLLAARHVEQLYATERVSRKLAALIDSERARRPSALRELNLQEDHLEAAYRIMQWCDRASLILCRSELPAMMRRIEVAALAPGTRSEMWQAEDESVKVSPWPFAAPAFEVSVEVRTLAQMVFKSDRELE
jgi:hypothetical protein